MFRDLFTRKSGKGQFPSRRKPLKGFGDFLGNVYMPVVFVGLVVALLRIEIGGDDAPLKYMIYVTCGVMLVFALWYGYLFLQMVCNRLIMSRGSAMAAGRIVSRDVQVSEGQGGRSYTHYVLFEYTPMLAESSSGLLALNAVVSKKIYDSLTPGETVTVTYATGDPRIVLFEGE